MNKVYDNDAANVRMLGEYIINLKKKQHILLKDKECAGSVQNLNWGKLWGSYYAKIREAVEILPPGCPIWRFLDNSDQNFNKNEKREPIRN